LCNNYQVIYEVQTAEQTRDKKFTFHVRESGRRAKHGEGEGKGQKDDDRGLSEHPTKFFQH